MTRDALDDRERACLKNLRLSALPASDCCPPEVLRRLIDCGLIKEVPVPRVLPPLFRKGYVLTGRGEAALWEE
ncbi:MAG: hypothetical protein ACM3ST_16005 [Bdellovibrio bacteriovorus]